MRGAAAVGLVTVALVAGCGSGAPSAESVVRAWSQALNDDDNDRAADLFAPDAQIVQAGHEVTLKTHAEAVAWNAALPCSGKIVSIDSHGNTATATFLLGDRRHSRCDGPGERSTAIFKVVKGKIVLWHQTPAKGPTGPTI
ncbi:MAG TPA: nuclear transport factor 2 family protein [Gaiellaceae bacterium]